jgi:probable HAF family extracellular repeat protein
MPISKPHPISFFPITHHPHHPSLFACNGKTSYHETRKRLWEDFRVFKALIAFSLLVTAALAAAQPTYTVTTVGGNQNYPLYEVFNLNNLGQVSGVNYNGNTNTYDVVLADQNGNILADYGTLPGTNGIYLGGLNDNSIISGYGFFEDQYFNEYQQAAIFSSQLPVEFGPEYTVTQAINNNGQVVGYTGASRAQGFFYDSVNGFRLAPDAGYSQIFAENQAGVAVGFLLLPNDAADAGMFTPTGYTDLGGLPGANYSEALAINDTGAVVGVSEFSSGDRAVLWSGGQMEDLGGLPSSTPNSQADGINDSGEIVGYSTIYVNSEYQAIDHGWVILNGSMYDLNDIATAPNGDYFYEALAVNNLGQILAYGVNDYGTDYLLSPNNTLNVSASPAGAGAVNTAGGTITAGTSVTVTATPVSGAQFVSWTVNGVTVSTSASYTFLMGNSENLVANFSFLSPSLTISNTHVTGGSSATAYLNLGAIAAADTTFTLTATPSDVTIPGTVTVLAGTAQAQFTVTAIPVDVTTLQHINAKLGALSYNLKFDVQAPVLTSISSLGSQTSGNPVSILVSLNGPAGPSGFPVSLSDNNAALDVSVGMEAIPSGQSSLTFTLPTNPVATNQVVTLYGTNGSTTVNCTVGVRAAVLRNITLTSNSGVGGVYAPTGTVNMNGTVAAPTTVYLQSSDPSITVPASVVVPASASTVTFPVTSSPVSVVTTVTITATCGSVTTNRVVTVKP